VECVGKPQRKSNNTHVCALVLSMFLISERTTTG
jgi:hypothetical protein